MDEAEWWTGVHELEEGIYVLHDNRFRRVEATVNMSVWH